MRVVVHSSTIEAIFDALLKSDDLAASIAIFVSYYVGKESNRVKNEENIAGSRRNVCELPPSHPTADPSDDDHIPCKEKENWRVHRDKKIEEKTRLPSSSDKLSYCRTW